MFCFIRFIYFIESSVHGLQSNLGESHEKGVVIGATPVGGFAHYAFRPMFEMPKHQRNQRRRGGGSKNATTSNFNRSAPRRDIITTIGNDEDDDSPIRERPPRHLRGREIGLWYAQKSRERKDRTDSDRPAKSVSSHRQFVFYTFTH